ncbi:autotransporter-associated beta strand repeat-containing protein [Luteolibacter ambystomatis]|uniref:Autotransporter-associated beta strand repeat-containing protein n=1 Tax=Luteolibacter ambystomatis TaxID=2824561 RepID=A0A975PG07_9BACT|nr:autotransporter-associated beta strand repeat-containing protein [Luteolibacter ambystomatis]QUE52358.1 autotransporter-associated beta strand repeat-containing protein [Luteolibacter ambystomatis]
MKQTFAFLVFLTGACSSNLMAATATWTGAYTGVNWNADNGTSSNWTGGAGLFGKPAANDALIFSGTTGLANNNDLAAGTIFTSTTFDATAGAFVIGGNSIVLGGDVTNNSTNAQTINLPLTYTAVRTFNAASGDITLGGVLSGGAASGITKTGANKLTLAGSGTIGNAGAPFPLNLRNGTLRLNGGAYTITGEAAIGDASAGNGAAGNNVNLTIDQGSLAVSSWFSIARGNGVGAVSSDVVLNNAASITTANLGGGYNAASALNLPKGSLTLNNTSTFTVSNNGVNFNFGESAGSNLSVTLNGSSTFTHNAGTATRSRFGMTGKASFKVASPTATANFHAVQLGTAGGSGALINKGNLNLAAAANIGTDILAVGQSANGYGYFCNDNGAATNPTVTAQEVGFGGVASSGTGTGVVDIKSGTFITNSWFAMNRNQTANSSSDAQLNITGGTLKLANSATNNFVNWAGGTGTQTGVINVTGSGVLGSNGTSTDLSLQSADSANSIGIVSIASGGTVQVNSLNAEKYFVADGVNVTAGSSYVNFNNGTLRSNAASTKLLAATLTGVYIHSGGATFDTNGVNSTTAKGLQAPTGNGITSIAVATAGSGYIGRPNVKITGGGGVGATAMATYDEATGTITGITITSPGSGYTSTPTVTLVGGGAATAATVGTVSTGAVTSGGISKIGTGILSLGGTSTYTGATSVTGGTLDIAGTIGSGGGTAITSSTGLTEAATGVIAGASSVSITGGTSTLGGVNTYTGSTSVAAASSLALTGTLGSGTGTAVSTAGTFTESAAGVIAGSSSLSVSGGSASLAGANTYTGSTSVTGGTLTLTGTGNINSTSGLTVNGSGAKLVQTSSTTLSSPVNLGTGTVDGTGLVDTINVGHATGGVVANGNGSFSPLSVNNLTFNGTGAMNVAINSASPGLVVGALTTNAAGPVTLNVSNPIWSNGQTYDVVSYTSLGGAGYSAFTLGTVSGLGARQTANIQNSGASLQVVITGDNPTWTGALSNEWSTAVLASPKNWKSVNLGTSTDFLANDAVIFGDAATGSTSVNIAGGNVVPSSTTFNNTNFAYTIGSTGGFGIAGTGILIKSGINQLTLNSANTYSGGTQFNDGQLNINNASAIGTGPLTLTGSYLDNTSGSPVTLSTNNAQAWNSNALNFIGSNSLNLGTGNVTMSVSPVITTDGSATLTVGGSISGAFGISKTGAGTLALGGAASTFTGGVTFSSGTLAINGAAALGTGAFNIDGGAVLDNTSAGAVTLTTTNNGTWNNDITFTGTQSLNLGAGAITLGGTGDRTFNVVANAFTVGSFTSTQGLVKTGAGTLGLGAAGITNLGGTLTVQAGKIQTGINDLKATGLAGSGTIENGSGVVRWLYITNPVDNTFTGVLQDGAGVGKLGLLKAGAGKLTLTGNSSMGDQVTVNGGLLNVTGSLSLSKTVVPTALAAGGGIRVGTGATLGSAGEVWLSNVENTYGSLNIDGGTVNVGSWLAFGRGGGNGLLTHNGGTLNISTNNLTLGSFGGAATGTIDTLHGVATFRGSSVTDLSATAANQGNIYVGENTTGVMTMMESASVTAHGPNGVIIAKQNTTNSAGVFNLLGGVLTTTSITGGTGTSTANFNGGTVKAFADSATFIATLGNAFVRSGGLTVDLNGKTLTAPQALLAPPGSGISASGLVVSGSGYFEAPIVQITGGDGIGATAIASIDSSGNLTGITVTNPGRNYTVPPTFTLIGGGGTGSVTGTPALVANTSGAVTVKGAGSLTLGGANSYTGLTSVGDSATTNISTLGITNDSGLGSTDAGTIVHGVAPGAGTIGTSLLLGTVTIPAGEGITLDTGAAGQRSSIRVAGTADSAVINGNITLAGSGRAQLYSEGTGASSLVINGNISGTVGDSFAVRGGAAATATGTINGTVSIGTVPFQKTDASVWTINSTGNSWGATTISVGTLKLGVNDALPTTTGITIGQNGQSAIFDLNGKNQTITGLAGVAGSTAISVTSATAATLTMNNTLAQTFGTNGGIISGAIKLVKTGAGTFNLSGIHTYTGDTTVSAGKLSLTNAYLADTADVRLATGATLDLTFAGTDTIDELYIDGVAQAGGTWGAIGSGATHETGLITGTGKLQVTTAGGSAFDTWASSKGLTTGNNGKADNPDGDGLNNLGEFALDGNPLSGVRAGKVVVKVAPVSSVNYLTLTLPVRGSGTTFSGSTEKVSALVDGIIYHVQGSDDLTNFTATVVEVTGTDATNIQSDLPVLSSGWFYRTFRSQNPVSSTSKTFLRAKITE